MTKIVALSVLTLCILTTSFGQSKHEINLTGNYVLIPHNQQTGSGYSMGYNQKLYNWLWVNTEFAYAQAMRVKGDTAIVGIFKTLPLTYMNSGFYLSVSPNIKLKLTDWLQVGFGLGPSACYQSSLYDKYHYIIPVGDYYEEEIAGVDFKAGYQLGASAQVGITFQLSEKIGITANGTYRNYINGERILTAGAGVVIGF